MDNTRVTRRGRRTVLAVAAGTVLVAVAAQVPATATATPAAGPAARHSSIPAAAAISAGAYDDTYYKDAIGKTGQELKDSLHRIISSTQTGKLSYDQVWDALKDTDEDPANSKNVILLYSGRSQSKDSHGGNPDDWNREHVWAKSHGDFGTATGPGTDIHHLRPADVSVNSIRGNKDFDNGGSEVEEAPGNRTDDDSFEPRDAVKGDVARMILYMAVRYDGEDGFPDLEPNDKVDNGSQPNIGRLSVLEKWNQQDPPDTFEKHRNQVIFDKYQHNRNPFVDHPEWVNEIW
ncbi:endonuclease I family protein [Streptomyces pinistramenti]|uniref:endonuclease I family protein n=1 Tax=Streptomyces pinistramenti TaxID=2884812 RepID=UPI001D05D3D3|nr:endonuclease [Streptomyces pinistramenti]MCB5910715.1 endonuclease [Streptomyces pinistramenti]